MPERSDLADLLNAAKLAGTTKFDAIRGDFTYIFRSNEQATAAVLAILHDPANRDLVLREISALDHSMLPPDEDDFVFPVTDNETPTPHVSRETNKGVALAIYVDSGPAAAGRLTGIPSGTIASWAARTPGLQRMHAERTAAATIAFQEQADRSEN